MNLRRTRAIARKEFRHILRDPRSLTMALAVPLLLLLLFGYALSLDVDRIPTLIYDADKTSASRELIERFRGSRYFDIRGFVDNYREIEKGIDKNEILMGVAIARGKPADVQILLDGSDSNTAAIALGYAESLLRNYSLKRPPIDPRLRVWYNPELESKNYVVPGLIAVILMIIAALLTSLTIAREWEMGTMEQLLSTPLRPAEMVLGKMLAFFTVGLADALVAITAGVFVFGVPLRGNVLLLGATSCIFLIGALFWGIFISAAARSQLLAYQIGIITSFLPACLV
jgi:ABC-2 type transport system permease protein